MGKFIATKFSAHQQRVIKKRPAKPTAKFPAERKLHKSKKVLGEKHVKSEPPEASNVTIKETPEEIRTAEDPNSECQNLSFEVATNSNSGKRYLKLICPDMDLFAVDELRYDQYTKYNFLFTIFDEIALEGLDGITTESYWIRLQNVLKAEYLPYSLRRVIWQTVCANEKIKFFHLPEGREPLISINRNFSSKKELHFVTEEYDSGVEIYKVEQAPKGSGQWGSCSTLLTRVDISEEVRKLSLDQAETTYENRLVLVADEDLRKHALFGDLMDPNYEFSQIEYCLLERVGRGRYSGEITLGPKSLPNSFGIDPKSIYHYCKRLSKEYLISRQNCFVSSNMEQTKVGRLLHLRRFYHRKKSKYLLMIEAIIDYLKKCPGYRAPYTSVRALFDNNSCVKFFKHQEFLKYVDTNIYVPFKEYYTEATYREYMTKNMTKERIIQLMQLKDPYMNVTACWVDGSNADSSDDEDEDRVSDVNNSRRVYNKDFVRDLYQFILSRGLEGMKTNEAHEIFDADFFTIRSVLKKLTIRKLVQPKKRDIGKQTVNQYVATCLLQKTEPQVAQATPVPSGSSSVLEKLKQRQKQKTDSLSRERVYTAEQFEAEREAQFLSLNPSPLPSATIQVPPIVCQCLIAEPVLPQIIKELDILLVRLKVAFEPFRLKLTLPSLPNNITWMLKKIDNRTLEYKHIFKEPFADVNSRRGFRPDHFSKAFLLRALLDNLKINNKEVIDFLDPNKVVTRAEKRPIEVKTEAAVNDEEDNSAANETKRRLGVYMGSNPTLVLKEKDETSGIVMEIYVSTPIGDYKTGDITQFMDNPSLETTERVLNRIMFILKTVQLHQVFEEMNQFLKLIYKEESEAGYDKKIDRKSLHRILKRLTNEGYVKIFSVNLVTGTSRKTQTYVCHPDVTLSHKLMQDYLRHLKEKVYCYINKAEETASEPVQKKEAPAPQRSPFIEDDVLRSIKEIKAITPNTIKAKSSKKSGKYYGRRPKFARLSLMHELLFYLIYELDKGTQPLPKSEVAQLFQNYQIKLTQADLKNLPPVYCKEISWKTFIPPLPHHHGWDEGWALLVDVILRFPITLVTRCYSITFVSTELQELLQHPIKRFYLLRNVSHNIRMIVMYRRKFIHDMYNLLVLLSYCGLAQFGPSSFRDKEKSFFYLNRLATLWDTTSSSPGYLKTEDKEYVKIPLRFNCMNDVLKYWSTMNNICINTNLSARRMVEGKTITLVDSSAKPSLNKARAVKTASNVKQFDTGELPGDHRGAAGLDSSLWSHIQRSWYFFATKNEPSFTETLDTLKLDQVVNKKVAFDQLKLPVTVSNKYYIVKPQDPKHALPSHKIKCKTRKTKPVVKRTVSVTRRKSPDKKKVGLDVVDNTTMRKWGVLRYRPHWNEEEDKLLILLKIASVFITPGTAKQIISYSTLRDVLHIVEPNCRDKTTRSIANRLKILQRDVPFLANIESLIPNLYKLVPIAKYFVPFRKFVLHGVDPSGLNRKYKLSDRELHNAFLFLAHYFMRHRQEVEVSLHGRNTSTDYFNEENLDFFVRNIEPFEKKPQIYREPESESDVRKYALRNTIQSALSHKHEQQGWSLQMYKIYQQFSEQVLKTELCDLKSLRMIQFMKKDHTRTFFTPYRLSAHYVFVQSSTFLYHTMEEAYKAFLELKCNSGEIDYSFEGMEEKKYGQMLGLNEVLSFMLTNAAIDLKFPEHHLILNPNVEDHSEVIDELAKRYQAKLKSDQKETDLQTELQTSSKIDDEDVEMAEPAPGPSTVPSEEPEIEFIPFDDDEPLDLSITAKNSTTIDNLKHWISDCIDTERVRSPSPELLNLEVNNKQEEGEVAKSEIRLAPAKEDERVLTLEEIKEEMLKQSDNVEKRSVPYISDLTKLLSVNFEEIEHDERAYFLMKKHFVQRYPALEKLTVEGLEGHYLSNFLQNRASVQDIWVKIEREAHVGVPSDLGVAFDAILEKGGTIEDVSLANDIIQYVYDKNIYGAAGYELKVYEKNGCSLQLILQTLIEHHILLRTGVCSVRFVHHNYQNPWLTDTFKLTPEQAQLIPRETETEEALQKLKADIQSVDITKWIKIKALPWVTVEGTLDKDMMKMWLSQVFSYCIENPKCPLTVLCDKFCFLKPVDVFYLVEILEEAGALEMRWLPIKNTDLFSEYESLNDVKATLLDKFEEIYVEPNNVCFLTVGSFFHGS